MPIKLFSILLFFPLAIGCTNSAVNNNSAVRATNANVLQTAAADAAQNDRQKAELTRQIEQIAKTAGGRTGGAATVLETGESVSLNATERFPMLSVYKLPIAMTVLSQTDAGKLKLDQKLRIEKKDVYKTSRVVNSEKYPNGAELTVEELLRAMISESDNTACDALLQLVGEPGAVMQYLDRLGASEIVVANYEKELAADWQTQYRNFATPAAAVNLLQKLHERRGLSEQSQRLLLEFMTETATGARRLKGLLPADATVAHKTGTSGTRDNITAATNDIGIIALPNKQHLAIAVFVSDSPADETAREETIAKIASTVWNYHKK